MIKLNAILNILKGRPTIYNVTFDKDHTNTIHDYENDGLGVYDTTGIDIQADLSTNVYAKGAAILQDNRTKTVK